MSEDSKNEQQIMVPLDDLDKVENILARRKFDAFGGIYKLKQVGNNYIKL